MTTETPTLETLAADLGLTLESSAPRPHVEPDWLAVAYDCTLSRNGRVVWSGPYRMGLGCVEKHWKAATTRPRLIAYQAVAWTLADRPSARLLDRNKHAAAAAAVAHEFGVKPPLPDVLACLISDGPADFDALTFDQWCADYGYDTDSRKAFAAYEACCDTGRKLRAAFTPEELSALREAASNH